MRLASSVLHIFSSQPILLIFPDVNERALRIRQIYPSEFGKKRMAEEEERGPPELFDAKENEDGESSEDEDERKVHKAARLESLTLLYFIFIILFHVYFHLLNYRLNVIK